MTPVTPEHLVHHLRIEADQIVDRGIVTRGQRLVVRDLLLQAVDEIDKLQAEVDLWKRRYHGDDPDLP